MNASSSPLPKLDLFRLHKADYAARRHPRLVTPSPGQYLLVEGTGAPGAPLFEARVGALYAMAYTIKMTRKFDGGQDYAIGKLEARYPGLPVTGEPMPPVSGWHWELLLRTPDFVSEEDLARALGALRKRGKEGDSAHVRLVPLDEGPCVQMLHQGPYEEEAGTIAEMRRFAAENGQELVGPHHEIYLSDPRRVAPERLRTLLRIPVCPGAPATA